MPIDRLTRNERWRRVRIFATGAVVLLGCSMAALAEPAEKPAKAAGKAVAADAAGSSDGSLKTRVESLEEQLVDMQVVVGTLESLAKNGAGSGPTAYHAPAPAPSGGGGVDSSRLDGLDTQIRALTAQVQQLSDQVRSMGGTPRRSDIAAPATTAAVGTTFGSTTVTPGGDAIGGLIDGDGPPPVPNSANTAAAGAPPAPIATATLPPASDGTDPKQLYETAYGYLLQRDYGAAETAFDEFLKKFPSDSLSGNAQYWLGESYFVRGQYKAAAGAFLKGYQTYAQSQKAPDSLLKLAMSLDRLGQKDAACSSYSELTTKFPNAPQNVKARAQSERQRVGCS